MLSVEQLRRKQENILSEKADVLYTIPGLMGRASDEVLKITTRPGYIYVRIGSDETLAQAFWLGPVAYDRACICGYDGISTQFRVLRLRQDSYTMAGYTPVPEVDEHGITHLYPDPDDTVNDHRGTDVAFVSMRQVLELRLGKHTSGNFTIRVERALLEYSNTAIWVPAQTLDLTTSVPGWGARWTLIYLLPDGTIGKSDGAIKVASALTVADIPIPTFDHFRSGAVMLWDGQAQIRDDGGRRDIHDMRFPQSLTPATGGSSTTTTTVSVTPRWHVDGPLAVYDEVDGVWRLGQAFEFQSAVMYLNNTGSAGTTVVDIERSVNAGISWSTVFPTQANRPAIVAGASKINVGTPDAPAPLSAGTLLRANIEGVATGARGLSVQMFGEEGSVVVSDDLYTIIGVG